MKSVLISIRPKWCEPICNLIKTIEVRKTRPKLDTPFKCYIYCTKASKKHQTISGSMCINTDELYRLPNGAIKHDSSIELMCYDNYSKDNFLNGKVIGEFVCDRIDYFDSEFVDWANNVAPAESTIDSMGWNKFLEIIHTQACITDEELNEYFPEEIKAYLWHISDLKIYDKPKELRKFKKYYDDFEPPCAKGFKCEYTEFDYQENCECCGIDFDGTNCIYKHMSKAPQSWGYVESEDK